jgi:hypothetical protein
VEVFSIYLKPSSGLLARDKDQPANRVRGVVAYDHRSAGLREATGAFVTEHCQVFVSGSWGHKNILLRDVLQVGSTSIQYIVYFGFLIPVSGNFFLLLLLLVLSWVLALCAFVGRCQHFGEKCCLHLLGSNEDGERTFLRNVGIDLRNYTTPKSNTTTSQ